MPRKRSKKRRSAARIDDAVEEHRALRRGVSPMAVPVVKVRIVGVGVNKGWMLVLMDVWLRAVNLNRAHAGDARRANVHECGQAVRESAYAHAAP